MDSDAKFKINLKEGLLELEGSENFVNNHLEKYEEILKIALKELITNNNESLLNLPPEENNNHIIIESVPSDEIKRMAKYTGIDTKFSNDRSFQSQFPLVKSTTKHGLQSKFSINIPLLPVDLKANNEKIGLREFYKEKKPSNHYEKTTLFVYYLTKFNKKHEIKYGEILSCYEEINEKKPSVIDIVKNSIRYKGWLEPGAEKYSTRLTISGENFIKFDLPRSS